MRYFKCIGIAIYLLSGYEVLALEGFPEAIHALYPEVPAECSSCHADSATVPPSADTVTQVGQARYRALMEHEAQRNALLPALPAWNNTTDFTVFGDTRTQIAIHKSIVEMICADNPTLAIHTGDIVADGSISQQWDEAREAEDCLIRDRRLVHACGNHEGEHCTNNRIRRELGISNRYYEHEWRGITFLILDSNNIDNAQLAWLRQRPTGKIYIPVYHHVPYPTMAGHRSESRILNLFVPEFKRLGVRLSFNGHNHGYDRAIVDGTTYVTSGGGGAPLYPCGLNQNYTMFCMSDYSYLRCSLTGTTVTCESRRINGEVADRFSVSF